MDPNIAWDRMCQALEERDPTEAYEHALNLHQWLLRAGFNPTGIDRHIALAVTRAVIESWQEVRNLPEVGK